LAGVCSFGRLVIWSYISFPPGTGRTVCALKLTVHRMTQIHPVNLGDIAQIKHYPNFTFFSFVSYFPILGSRPIAFGNTSLSPLLDFVFHLRP
jgi:hypothetical protein